MMEKCSRTSTNALGGFSLIELLVVISLVILLVSLTIAGVSGGIQKAQQTRSASNLRQLALANLAYAVDHGRFAPVDNQSNDLRWSGRRRSDGSFDPAEGYLADYLGESGMVNACPKFERLLGSGSFELGTGGYGYNDTYIGGRPGGAYARNGDRISAKVGALRYPATTVMFTTSAYATGDTVQEYPFSHPPFWDFGDGPNGWGMRPSPSTHFRFNGHALVAWCDARVTREPISARDVGTNPHGGDAEAENLGWFGPDEENGFWNPNRSQ